MRNIVSGAVVGIVAFVVLAPVIAWIMPKSEAPAADSSDVEADGRANPFVPLPAGDQPTSLDRPFPRAPTQQADEPAKDREEGRGIISFNVGGDREGGKDDDAEDDAHEDEDEDKEKDDGDRREGRKAKHKHGRGH